MKTTKHTIDNIILTKHNNGSDNLMYDADSKTFEFDGEFYVDKEHNLHHEHLFDDGEEIEIVIPYENGNY